MTEAGVFGSRRGSGRWLVLQRSSCRLAYRVEVFHADAAPLARIRPDLLDRDDMLMLVLPGVPDENGEGADQPEDGEPPDVPDDGEAADRGEEGDR